MVPKWKSSCAVRTANARSEAAYSRKPDATRTSISRSARDARTTSRTATVASTTSSTGKMRAKTRALVPSSVGGVQELGVDEYRGDEEEGAAGHEAVEEHHETARLPRRRAVGKASRPAVEITSAAAMLTLLSRLGEAMGSAPETTHPGVPSDRNDGGQRQQQPRPPMSPVDARARSASRWSTRPLRRASDPAR